MKKVIALMLTEWIGMSRIARAEMLKLKEQEFVLASRTLGAGSFFIIFKEVLPNIIGPIITQVMFSIPTGILKLRRTWNSGTAVFPGISDLRRI